MPKLHAEIADCELVLEDTGLYARDPKGFERIMATLDKARAQLAAAEDEWLVLEEKRESLGA